MAQTLLRPPAPIDIERGRQQVAGCTARAVGTRVCPAECPSGGTGKLHSSPYTVGVVVVVVVVVVFI